MHYLFLFLISGLLFTQIEARDFRGGGGFNARPGENRQIQRMEQERAETFEGGADLSDEEYYDEVAPPTNVDDPDYLMEDHPLQEEPLQEDPIE